MRIQFNCGVVTADWISYAGGQDYDVADKAGAEFVAAGLAVEIQPGASAVDVAALKAAAVKTLKALSAVRAAALDAQQRAAAATTPTAKTRTAAALKATQEAYAAALAAHTTAEKALSDAEVKV